jgi:hypothetical protein
MMALGSHSRRAIRERVVGAAYRLNAGRLAPTRAVAVRCFSSDRQSTETPAFKPLSPGFCRE